MRDKSIFPITPDGGFFGRTPLIEHILQVAKKTLHPSPAILLKGKRWVGKTEVLRRVHRELFWEQAEIVPVYYRFKGGLPASDLAEDFLKAVVRQYAAFIERRPALAVSEMPLLKLKRHLQDSGLDFAVDIVSRHLDAKKGLDLTSVLRNALSAPKCVAEEGGQQVFLILDDLERLSGTVLCRGGPSVINEIVETLKEPDFSFIASGRLTTPLEGMLSGCCLETITMTGLGEDDAVAMMAEVARNFSLDFDTEILTLAGKRLGGNPMYIKETLLDLKRGDVPGGLKDLKGFADLYVSEVSRGGIAKALASAVKLGGEVDLRVLGLLMKDKGALSLEEICGRLDLEREDAAGAIGLLAALDLVERNLGSIKWAGDGVERDYIDYVYSTLIRSMSPDEARTWMVRDILRQGSLARGEKMKGELKRDVLAVLSSFRGQSVPGSLFRAGPCGDNGPGVQESEDRENIINLPFMSGSFEARGIEKNESGVPVVMAQGFQNKRYDAGGEVIWIAGVKDAASPVNLGDVENFLRRTSILTKRFRCGRVVRWFVGREGFSREAAGRLEREGVYLTDGPGLQGLKTKTSSGGRVGDAAAAQGISQPREFEVVLPPGRNAELVGVRAAAEISSEMGFDEDSIARIKASVVEACINAFEHSRHSTGRTHLRFIQEPDKLTIHISNPGVYFDETSLIKSPARPGGLPRKRGWGMELMKGFMDEVRVEGMEGGTRMVLVKYLAGKGVEKDDGER
ncbi:MAG: hypothetical protein BMS9Abin23_0350 [Thermodesulfobacteriota bacterium]|nr:MAG: hypothetical protein BMS9Abin23_0350 [Thermodesulfobacteriota bacterium]